MILAAIFKIICTETSIRAAPVSGLIPAKTAQQMKAAAVSTRIVTVILFTLAVNLSGFLLFIRLSAR